MHGCAKEMAISGSEGNNRFSVRGDTGGLDWCEVVVLIEPDAVERGEPAGVASRNGVEETAGDIFVEFVADIFDGFFSGPLGEESDKGVFVVTNSD